MKAKCALLFFFSASLWAAPHRPLVCEEIKTTETIFVSSPLKSEKSTIGQDELVPVIKKVEEFLLKTKMKVTEMIVTATTSRTPYWPDPTLRKLKLKALAGALGEEEQKLLKESDAENLFLARARENFAKQVFSKFKKEKSLKVSIKFNHRLAGPSYNKMDRALIGKLDGFTDASYFKKEKKKMLESTEAEYKKELIDLEEIKKPHNGLNLYELKFNPFHGFKVVFLGTIMNCGQMSPTQKIKVSPQ